MEPTFTREARDSDHAAIDELLRAAFDGSSEARLVRELRAQKAMFREIVMPWEEAVAGYLALSRFVAPDGWLALAPVAVHPQWQNGGRGQFMVKNIVREVVEQMGRTIIVLGDGKFYRRCGFLATRAARLASPYGNEHLLLAGPGMTVPTDTLVYPQAFAKLG